MPGINGFSGADELLLRKMNELINHQGSDASLTYVDGQLSIGCLCPSKDRAVISDWIGPEHKLPANEDGTILTAFDGEVYNSQDIRHILKRSGHCFRTSVDMELVTHAYEEYGLDFPNHLDGTWSAVIYDKRESKVILSRDIFGAKTLYYYVDDQRFIFSSQVKTMFLHKIDRAPNDPVLFEYLLFFWQSNPEETFFKGVKAVAPGCHVVRYLNTLTSERLKYYTPRATPALGDAQNIAHNVRSLLQKSMGKRVAKNQCDKIGIALSGGLDSSSILCTAKWMFPEIDAHAFSLAFPGKQLDESIYQELVVSKTNSKWHRVTFDARELIASISQLVHIQEFPVVSTGAFGQYAVFRAAKDAGFEVLFDGAGADGLFAGLNWVYGYYLYELMMKLQLLRLLRESKALAQKYGIAHPLRQLASVAAINLLSRICPRTLSRLFWYYRGCYISKAFLDRYSSASRNSLWRASTLKEILDHEGIGPLLLHVRHAAMNASYWGIELRFPFLDRALQEYSAGIPAGLKIRLGHRKAILRQAMRDLLPRQVLQRTDKLGGDTPPEMFLDEDTQKFVIGIINSESFRKRKYWNWQRVCENLKETVNMKRDWSTEIWRLVFLELWFRHWFENFEDLQPLESARPMRA